MKQFLFAAILFVFSVAAAMGQDEKSAEVMPSPAQENLQQKASYLLGYDFVQSLKSQQAEIDIDQLIVGIKCALEGKEIGMSKEEIAAVMGAYEQACSDRLRKHLQTLAAENQASGEAYLKTNGVKAGVLKLENGLQYRVVNQGTGSSPAAEDRVRVHYTGKTIDGKVFDSSVERGEPATFPVSGLIKGMTEGLMKMKVGDKWELTIPSSLAYGINAPAEIGPNQVLIFEVELLEILKK